MKIVSLIAENVKRLVAIEIRPDGNLVEITGKNGQGKTSVLDSIWWCLAGAANVQSQPIRKGQTEARIRLDLGEIVVTRTFKKRERKKDDPDAKAETEVTTSITVENADGARYPSPQKLLDSLIGTLTFDPLEFTRADPKAQAETLKRFVPDFNFADNDKAIKEDFDERTIVNRKVKEARSAAAVIVVPEGAPAERIDEAALVAELEAAGQHNAAIETRKANRQTVAQQIETAAAAASRARARAAELRAEAGRLDDQAAGFDRDAADSQARLDAAGPLPEPIDTAAVRTRIAAAREANAAVTRREERDAAIKSAAALEAEAASLTAAIEKRRAAMHAAIAAAKLPVEGLSLGDDHITLNDLPFDQASDAEQLRVSIAIAMALNPKLRVIRVRDGSLLDEDALKLVAEMAGGNDYQVWLEKVSSDGKVGFVIDDGMVMRRPGEVAHAAN